MSAVVIDPAGAVRGRVRVRERVIEKVVREVAAAGVGVPRDDVAVEVAERDEALVLHVATRLPIPDLEDDAQIRREAPLLERVRHTQASIAGEVARLTGRRVRRVTVTVTGAIVARRRRVR